MIFHAQSVMGLRIVIAQNVFKDITWKGQFAYNNAPQTNFFMIVTMEFALVAAHKIDITFMTLVMIDGYV